MYLIDTNVLSELRKAKSAKADLNVINWANSVEVNKLFLSSVTVFEIEMGILSRERKDPSQGSVLRGWFENQVIPAFSERIIAFDTKIALRCARLHVPDPKSERDSMIAATALANHFAVVTRNTKDFIHTGVQLINPWEFN